MENNENAYIKQEETEEQKQDNLNWDEYDKQADEALKNQTKKELIYQTRNFDSHKLRTEILTKNCQGGLTGLNNLGNTCFMNSAIQCLSNTEDLTYYFLSGKYKEDINTDNKHGLKGKLAYAWADLLEEMWLGNRKSTSPGDLKHTIARIAKQFTGYSQHDSQELLTFLIDGIHEDLNKITNKPYREIKEKQPGETDDEAAFRFWELHKQRNDSIFVDLFHGQFKSTITCPECHRISTTFDPFTTLSLPIPKLQKVDLFYVPKTNFRKTTKLSIFISRDALFFDIHDYIQQHLDTKMGKFRCMLVANNQCVDLLLPSENILSSLEKGFIFCSEINEKVAAPQAHIPLHVKDSKSEGPLDFKTYPRLVTLSEKMTFEELRVALYSFGRRFWAIPEVFKAHFGQKVDKLLIDFTENTKDFEDEFLAELLREEYYLLFNPTKQGLSGQLSEEVRKQLVQNFPAKFFLFDKRSESRSILLDRNFYFESAASAANANAEENSKEDFEKQILLKLESLKIRGDEEDNINEIVENYLFNYDENATIENYISPLKEKEIVLVFEINLDSLDQVSKKALTACRSIAVQENSKTLNINDCLNHFKLTEKLDKNNEWYCSVCKKHQKAFKKLELYYIPKNLILHMKRFEYTSTSKYRTYAEKIGNLVDFPLQDLNLKNFIIGPHNEQNGYDLYAVSQHFGGVGGGHYTACGKNNGKWYDYNDSSVSETRLNSVVSSSAYMLFYRRKDD